MFSILNKKKNPYCFFIDKKDYFYAMLCSNTLITLFIILENNTWSYHHYGEIY